MTKKMNAARRFLDRFRFSRVESVTLLAIGCLYLVGLSWRYVQKTSFLLPANAYAQTDSLFAAYSAMKPIVTTQRDTLVKSDTTTKADSTANDLDATSLETGRLNINRASKRQLMLLPGIGPALADRIIAYRTGTGPFSEVDQLLAVKGIGPKKLMKFRGLIVVE